VKTDTVDQPGETSDSSHDRLMMASKRATSDRRAMEIAILLGLM
jgi:hypothetical protein